MEDLRTKLLRLIVIPPDSDRTPESVADELLSATYRCADCVAQRPADVFAWRKDPRVRWQVTRQAYCRTHQSVRNSAAQKKRMAQEDARKAQTERAKARRPLDRPMRAKWSRMDYQKHPEKYAERYKAWVEANPEKRKASQDAWRERQKLRSRPSVTDARITGRRASVANARRIRRDEDA